MRRFSTLAERPFVSRRAMLYVPSSNPRMLQKSLDSAADSVAYDLEDSVTLSRKVDARESLAAFLDGNRPRGECVVRINAVESGFEEADLDAVLRARHIDALAIPKVNSPDHIDWVVSRIDKVAHRDKRAGGGKPIRIIAMIESAIAMVNIERIARAGQGHLDALLFAAEDYCADVGITRNNGGNELLYPRSKLVTTAKAFQLQTIDIVCVDFRDNDKLAAECLDGQRLGFDGKQAIHPSQVSVIQEHFSPSAAAIEQASRIVSSFEANARQGKGAYEQDGKMIDAPVFALAQKILAKAIAAGIDIPSPEDGTS